MNNKWKYTLATMAVLGMVGLQTQVVLGHDAAANLVNKKAAPISEQDANDNAVHKKAESIASEQDTAEKQKATSEAKQDAISDVVQGKTVIETKHNSTAVQRKVTVGTVTLDLTPEQVAEELALRKFLREKKASFVEEEEENLDNVGTTFTAKRVPQIVITDTFVKALEAEAKARMDAKQREPWAFPDVDVLKEKLEAISKKKPVEAMVKDGVGLDTDSDANDELDTESAESAEMTGSADASSVGDASGVSDASGVGDASGVSDASHVGDTYTKDSKDSRENKESSESSSSKDETKTAKDIKDKKDKKKDSAPKYPIDLLWTDKENIFLHEDVHVGATRGEVLFAWGAPRAMWRDNGDSSLLWLYQGTFDKEKTITKNEKSAMHLEEFSQSVKNTYSSDSLAGSNSSVGYVWLSLKDGKVTHLGMITGLDWPRFAIPATTLETFKPNTMTESDFSLMGYQLGKTFTNDPNRSWEERGKLYGQEFLGYKDVVIAYNKEHEITRVMINSSLGTTKRGISLGDSKYLLLYLYGVPDFEEPANYHDSTKGVVYGYRHPVLEHTYLLFTLDDKFVREILLSNQKKSELVSAMK